MIDQDEDQSLQVAAERDQYNYTFFKERAEHKEAETTKDSKDDLVKVSSLLSQNNDKNNHDKTLLIPENDHF